MDEPEDGDGGSAEYSLVLAFDSDDPEFTRGFAAGQIWERLEQSGYAERLVTTSNAEMVMRIAEAKGLPFSAEDVGYDWLQVRIGHPTPRTAG